MSNPYTPEEWVDEIETETADFENFTVTNSSKEALLEIFEETYDIAGPQAVQDLGEFALVTVEYQRHPKSSRMRNKARRIISNEYEKEIPIGSPLLRSSH